MSIFSFGQPDGGICQLGFIVKDVRAAIAHNLKTFGVGPWFFMEKVEISNATYHGRPMEFVGSMACANTGHMMIELIQQHNEAPSIFTEVIKSKGYGLHHQAVVVRDFPAKIKAYEAMGYETVFYCETGMPNRVAYVDTKGASPFFIEVIEAAGMLEAVFNGVYRASVDWDGKNPIRDFVSYDQLTGS